MYVLYSIPYIYIYIHNTYIYIYIFGFGLSSSVLSNVLLIVLTSIARRNAATSRAPPLCLWYLGRKYYMYLCMYCSLSDDVVSSKTSSLGMSRGIFGRRGMSVSAARTLIIGVLFHGISCLFLVQLVRTHITLIILVI